MKRKKGVKRKGGEEMEGKGKVRQGKFNGKEK